MATYVILKLKEICLFTLTQKSKLFPKDGIEGEHQQFRILPTVLLMFLFWKQQGFATLTKT